MPTLIGPHATNYSLGFQIKEMLLYSSIANADLSCHFGKRNRRVLPDKIHNPLGTFPKLSPL